MKKIIYPSFLFLFFLVSCSKDEVPETEKEKPVTEEPVVMKNIVTGSFVDAASGSIGIAGGKIGVTETGSPVSGLELDIPGNSFKAAQSFKISYSEIKSHQLGANVNPISPLIKITTGAGYSDRILRLTVPVKYPQGSIPIGFFYDETTGKLEGIPFEKITPNSITLLTRHLMPPSKLKSGNLEKSATAEGGANIFISSISESLLNGQPVISSGFKPGIDDWEFVNYGSYMASGGHCAGQNMAAMWYYYEKKPTEGKLYEKFSDTPNFWMDNAVGYRFCSVIHRDLEWDGTVATLFENYIDKNQELDRLKLMTIAGTMLVTGEPQGIGIYRQTGTKTDGSPKYAGHDLICYQVSVSNGKLFISDPNHPAVAQEITFSGNKFQPYTAALNGNAASHPYPFVTYYAKTAYIDWDKIGKRWDEVINKTIGSVAPNNFPAYTLEVKGTNLKIKEGLSVSKDTLTVNVVCPTAEVYYNIDGKKMIKAQVFDKDGQSIGIGNVVTNATTVLKTGKNKLGYYVLGWRAGDKDANNKYYDHFIDFKWYNVYYMPLTIEPNPLAGEPDKEYKFTARTKGAAPASAKYVWNFGDNTTPQTVLNDSTVKHTFTQEGTFKVQVQLFDNSNNVKIADTTSTATIKIKKLVPVIDSLGTRYYGKNYLGLYPWGCTEMGLTAIHIHGKDWSTDTEKTVVKVDGEVVPIKNLLSSGGKYVVNKNLIHIDIPKNKKGKITVVVESEGEISQPKEYFVGIPKTVLKALPLVLQKHQFRFNYIDHTNNNKLTSDSWSHINYSSNSQIESAEWNGNFLTVQGKIVWSNITTPTLTKSVYEFSDDGTTIKNIQVEMTSLNLDIKFSVKVNMVVSLQTNYEQLIYNATKIPASDFTFVSGTRKWTSPPTPFAVSGFIEGLATWQNEMNLIMSFKK